jgi:regulator of PEP synthase PpsR (kinase-PPPase family)
MSDYYPYWKKNKRKNNSVVQNNVVQNKDIIIQIRIDNNLNKKINERCGENKSKFIREIISNYIKQLEEIEWQEETKNW